MVCTNTSIEINQRPTPMMKNENWERALNDAEMLMLPDMGTNLK